MKPRRWLAYKIELNDLLKESTQILDRFEASDIPLDGTFGSNTEPGNKIPGLLLAIGPRVEPARLLEVLALLANLGQLFVCLYHEAEHAKAIAIGSLNLCDEPIVALDEQLLSAISRRDANAASIVRAIETAPKVEVLPYREPTREDGPTV